MAGLNIKVANQVADALRSCGYSTDQCEYIFDRLADVLCMETDKDLANLLVLKKWEAHLSWPYGPVNVTEVSE